MTYEQLKALAPENFKRACGVYPQTFEQCCKPYETMNSGKSNQGGLPLLALEDQLLMALQYWREYRTYFHLGLSWGLDESVVCRTVQKIENLLLKSKAFHIPGKKKLRAGGTPFDVIVVDVAESPVERPQKNNGDTIVGRKSAIPKKRKSS
jgi:hypothetical protein